MLAEAKLEAFDERWRGLYFSSMAHERHGLQAALADARLAYTEAKLGNRAMAAQRPPRRRMGRRPKALTPHSVYDSWDGRESEKAGSGTQDKVAEDHGVVARTLQNRLSGWELDWPPDGPEWPAKAKNLKSPT